MPRWRSARPRRRSARPMRRSAGPSSSRRTGASPAITPPLTNSGTACRKQWTTSARGGSITPRNTRSTSDEMPAIDDYTIHARPHTRSHTDARESATVQPEPPPCVPCVRSPFVPTPTRTTIATRDPWAPHPTDPRRTSRERPMRTHPRREEKPPVLSASTSCWELRR